MQPSSSSEHDDFSEHPEKYRIGIPKKEDVHMLWVYAEDLKTYRIIYLKEPERKQYFEEKLRIFTAIGELKPRTNIVFGFVSIAPGVFQLTGTFMEGLLRVFMKEDLHPEGL